MGVGDERANEIASLLSELEPGYLPFPVFAEMARLMVISVIELVPLRQGSGGRIEVLLLRRDPDDRFWPGLWHTPGTVIRADDPAGSWDGPLKRLLADELNGAAVETEPQFIENVFLEGARGKGLALLFWMELRHSDVGEYYPVDRLPEDIVKNQRPLIATAANSFRKHIGDADPSPSL